MVVALKHKNMSNEHTCKFYENLVEFGKVEFDIEVTGHGQIIIDGVLDTVSYVIGTEKKQYTKEEAFNDYCHSSRFKDFAKSRFWTVYEIKQKII